MINTELEVAPDNQITHANKNIMMDCSSVSEKYYSPSKGKEIVFKWTFNLFYPFRILA